MPDLFKSAGEAVANLLGAGPRGGPLGGVKDIAGPITGSVLTATGFPELGIPLTVANAGGQFSKGNTLGGILDLGAAGFQGASVAGVGPFASGGGGGGAGASAGGGASALSASGPGSLADAASAPLATPAGFGTGDPFQIGAGAIPPMPTGGLVAPSEIPGLAPPVSSFVPGAVAGGAGTGGAGSAAAKPEAPGIVDSLRAGNFGGAVGALGSDIAAHPGLALGGAGLAFEALKPQPKIPNLDAQQNQAGALGAEGAALGNPLLTGNLPPGAEAQVRQGTESAKAAIRSQFAEAGLSGSSMEAAALAKADEQAASQTFQIAQSMAQTGLQATGMSDQIYANIMNTMLGENKSFQDAIIGFSQAAAGGGPRIQIGGGNGP